MSRVASRAATVLRATMVIRMDFHRAGRLNSGEAHQDQKDQQGSEQFLPTEHTHSDWTRHRNGRFQGICLKDLEGQIRLYVLLHGGARQIRVRVHGAAAQTDLKV
jgi:hypothetical protein